jgi:hypothetical protein
MHTHYSTSYTRVEIICALIYIVLSARFMFKTSLHTNKLRKTQRRRHFLVHNDKLRVFLFIGSSFVEFFQRSCSSDRHEQRSIRR